jgi:hypothetical protein
MKVIDTQENTLRVMEAHAELKMKLWNDLLTYLSDFITIDKADYKELSESNFKAFAVDRLRKKGKDVIPKGWTNEQVAEFYGLSYQILYEIQRRFKDVAQLPFNSNYSDVVMPDVQTYAVTKDELRRLDLSKRFIALVDEFKAEGITVYTKYLVNGLSGSLLYEADQLKPSTNFIKQIRYQ